MATGRGKGPWTTTTTTNNETTFLCSVRRRSCEAEGIQHPPGYGGLASARGWESQQATSRTQTNELVVVDREGHTHNNDQRYKRSRQLMHYVASSPPKAFCLGSRERALRKRLPYSRSNTSGLMVLFRHTTFISTSAVVLTVISRTVARPAVPTPVISTSPHR